MKIGDCINVWWAKNDDGSTSTWMNPLPLVSRDYEDLVADIVARDFPNTRRLGVWRVKEIKA